MSGGFNWTPKRDAQLRSLRIEGLSLKETARAIGCDVEHVRLRAGELTATRVAVDDVAAVPRPIAVRRPGLINLSKAPSAMEARFARGDR